MSPEQIRLKNEQTMKSIRLIMIDVLAVMKQEIMEKEDQVVAELMYNSVTKILNTSLDEMIQDSFIVRELIVMNADVYLNIDLGTKYSEFIVKDEGEVAFEVINFLL